jgi:hypothetical protein
VLVSNHGDCFASYFVQRADAEVQQVQQVQMRCTVGAGTGAEVHRWRCRGP